MVKYSELIYVDVNKKQSGYLSTTKQHGILVGMHIFDINKLYIKKLERKKGQLDHTTVFKMDIYLIWILIYLKKANEFFAHW